VAAVEWGRPTKDKTGKLIYRSKCGRFTITKRSYVLPFACVGYILDGPGVERLWMRENDTLTDAKDAANMAAEDTAAAPAGLPAGKGGAK
jgi:hypothetical protein